MIGNVEDKVVRITDAIDPDVDIAIRPCPICLRDNPAEAIPSELSASLIITLATAPRLDTNSPRLYCRISDTPSPTILNPRPAFSAALPRESNIPATAFRTLSTDPPIPSTTSVIPVHTAWIASPISLNICPTPSRAVLIASPTDSTKEPTPSKAVLIASPTDSNTDPTDSNTEDMAFPVAVITAAKAFIVATIPLTTPNITDARICSIVITPAIIDSITEPKVLTTATIPLINEIATGANALILEAIFSNNDIRTGVRAYTICFMLSIIGEICGASASIILTIPSATT